MRWDDWLKAEPRPAGRFDEMGWGLGVGKDMRRPKGATGSAAGDEVAEEATDRSSNEEEEESDISCDTSSGHISAYGREAEVSAGSWLPKPCIGWVQMLITAEPAAQMGQVHSAVAMELAT
ncbi:UNVERIFIED_CONTAM: hypothetical protein K2H54_067799 [Gekko kuhli]